MKSLAFLTFISMSSCLAKFGESTNKTAKITSIELGNYIFSLLGLDSIVVKERTHLKLAH